MAILGLLIVYQLRNIWFRILRDVVLPYLDHSLCEGGSRPVFLLVRGVACCIGLVSSLESVGVPLPTIRTLGIVPSFDVGKVRVSEELVATLYWRDVEIKSIDREDQK